MEPSQQFPETHLLMIFCFSIRWKDISACFIRFTLVSKSVYMTWIMIYWLWLFQCFQLDVTLSLRLSINSKMINSSNVGKLVHFHSHHNSVFWTDLSQRTMLFTIPICIHFETVLLSFCTLKFVRPRLYQRTSTYKQQTAVSQSGNPQMRMPEMFSLTH